MKVAYRINTKEGAIVPSYALPQPPPFTASFIRPSDDTIKFDRYFCT